MGVLQDRFKYSNLVELLVFIEARIMFLKKKDLVLKIMFIE